MNAEAAPALFCAVYVSRSASRHSRPVLDAMQRDFANRNRKLEVTGVLLAVGTAFLQVLEGDRDAVLSLLGRIRTDVRHTEVRVLYQCGIPERRFAAWSMALLAPDTQPRVSQAEAERLRAIARPVLGDGAAGAREVAALIPRLATFLLSTDR